MQDKKNLSKEIAQSAQKIIQQLNEFDSPSSKDPEISENSEFINLLSSLQTDESASLLQDVSRWTEARKNEYQKYEKPLLRQVEQNQSILEYATGDAIPAMQSKMNDFDLKLSSAKSHLLSLSENVINTAQSALDGNPNGSKIGKRKDNPQLQLESPVSNQTNSEQNDQNEIITQLKMRQEHFMAVLQDLDREAGALRVDLKNAKDSQNDLEQENKNLKEKVEEFTKKKEKFITNPICMEVCLEEKMPLEIQINENYLNIPLKQEKIRKIRKNSEEEEDYYEYEDDLDENNSKNQKRSMRKRKPKEVMRNIDFFETDLPPNDDFITIEKSTIPSYLLPLMERLASNSLDLNDPLCSSLINNLNTVLLDENNGSANDFGKDSGFYSDGQRRTTVKDWTKLSKSTNSMNDSSLDVFQYGDNEIAFDTNQAVEVVSSIAGEIAYEIKTNEKGEICFALTDESGNQIYDVSPEFVEEMNNEIQRDLQHLIQMNASARFANYESVETITDYDSNNPNSRSDMATTPTTTRRTANAAVITEAGTNVDDKENNNAQLKPFTVQVTDREANNSIENKLSAFGKSSNNQNKTQNNPNGNVQAIMPIGIRQKEGKSGYRLFFRDRNDAIVVDADVKTRTRDGLIVLNAPSPNIRVRIENGFSPEFSQRCRENNNFNFILQPYKPNNSSKRVVGVVDDPSQQLRSNFPSHIEDTSGRTACVWNSFPVRPPPLACRSFQTRPRIKTSNNNNNGHNVNSYSYNYSNYYGDGGGSARMFGNNYMSPRQKIAPLVKQTRITKPEGGVAVRRRSPDHLLQNRQQRSIFPLGKGGLFQ
ncbi:hypothetical protein TRFO_22639 [Tritrichomonas foetus]|uniref:Uncharacterized protein n=1 Tax=Tritrichomonas foetus TaxID=1144522 RepID=A0A1J4KHI3_9EUKA|nr:hypothetical protein TRFO_22639 [Tritrichomonas foetus]|eukprot:OHT08789.1 hypothetical protein TRFO_22639 [Tritrichomonas foetus]